MITDVDTCGEAFRNCGNFTLKNVADKRLGAYDRRAALTLEMKADRVLIDKRDARLRARQLGLGVLGILLRAR